VNGIARLIGVKKKNDAARMQSAFSKLKIKKRNETRVNNIISQHNGFKRSNISGSSDNGGISPSLVNGYKRSNNIGSISELTTRPSYKAFNEWGN
jgi:hypothetical protein